MFFYGKLQTRERGQGEAWNQVIPAASGVWSSVCEITRHIAVAATIGRHGIPLRGYGDRWSPVFTQIAPH